MRAKNRRGLTVTLAMAAILAGASTPALGAVTFSAVGQLGTAGSRANAMSPDGSVVVGQSQNANGKTEAFIWSTTSGLHGLGFPALWDSVQYSVATGVDIVGADEVKIAVTGQRDYWPDPIEDQAFLWSGNRAGIGAYTADMILLGGGFATVSAGLAVQSPGGAVMMTGHGKSSDWNGVSCDNWHGFLWSDAAPIQELTGTAICKYPIYGRGVSSNGRIAGQLQLGDLYTPPCGGARQAFLWNSATSSYHLIPYLPGGNENYANAISRDGEYCAGASVMAGFSSKAFVARVMFGTATPTIAVTEIPFLAGDDQAEALALSGQGERVGGRSSAGGGPARAFVWDAANGTQDVKTWLLNTHGIDVAAQGWTSLTEVTGFSADATAMAGNGIHNGRTEAWVVRGLAIFPPVIDAVTPDPGTTDQGVEYKRQLHLAQSMFTTVTWAKIAGPPGLAVNPATGFVYGWTPTLADVGSTFTITVSASNAAGTAIETWSVTVTNQGPGPGGSATGVAPVLYPTATAVTVKGITATGETTRVTLYRIRNGVESELTHADETDPPTLFTDGVHDFPVNAGDLEVDDVIQATQVRGGAESERSWSRVVFQPIPTPQEPPHLFWGFGDDFETPTLKRFWQLDEPMTLTSVQARGSQSLLEDAVSGGRLGMDAAPGNYQLGTQDRNPVLFEFWMYEEGVPPYTGAYARHVGGIQQCAGNGYNVIGELTGPKWLFEIGLLPTVRQPAKQAADPTKYQYRANQVGGDNRLKTANMDEPGCPLRSPGWHRFSIKVGANKVLYYVDGKLGHLEPNTNPAINAAYIGTWSGNTGTVNTGGTIPPTTVTLDGHTAYYDNVSLRQIVNHVPALDVTTIDVEEGKPASADITATDTDTPDLVTLTYLSGSLPAGLSLSEVSSSGSPTAKIMLTGTPAAGTVGTYELTFQTSDDLPGGTATGIVTINVTAPACHATPQDMDGDKDVDLIDFGAFQNCFNGPNRPWREPSGTDVGCMCLDGDNDLDIDLQDFGWFQASFNGPNRPAR